MEKTKYNIHWAKDMKQLTEDILDEYNFVVSENTALRTELANFKKEVFAEEEIARLRETVKRLTEELYHSFHITLEEHEAIEKFKENYKGRDFGAIGGAFTYKFTPTSIGTSGVIIGPDGKEFEFSEIN